MFEILAVTAPFFALILCGYLAAAILVSTALAFFSFSALAWVLGAAPRP